MEEQKLEKINKKLDKINHKLCFLVKIILITLGILIGIIICIILAKIL